MEEWRQFLAQWPVKTYEKGQMIVCQDTAPSYCYMVRRGFVKAYTIGNDGTEKPISFEGKDDLFPFDVVFGDSTTAKYFYDAYTKAEVYHISQDAFLSFVHEHPRLLQHLFRYLVNRTVGYHSHISSLEQAKAADKLIYALDLLVGRFGQQLADTRIHMTLPLTQQDLANFLGLTRETTSAQLKALERQGIIRYHRQQYVVHTERLSMLMQQR